MIYQVVNILSTSNECIVVKGRISVSRVSTNNANRINKKLTFKNNAAFTTCISKINNIVNIR